MELLVRKILVSIIIRQKRFVKKEFFPICRNFLNCCRSRTFFAQSKKESEYSTFWTFEETEIALFFYTADVFLGLDMQPKGGRTLIDNSGRCTNWAVQFQVLYACIAFCHGNLRSRQTNLLKFSNAHGILPEIERLVALGPGHKPPWKVRINRFHALPIWLALARRSFCHALFTFFGACKFFSISDWLSICGLAGGAIQKCFFVALGAFFSVATAFRRLVFQSKASLSLWKTA